MKHKIYTKYEVAESWTSLVCEPIISDEFKNQVTILREKLLEKSLNGFIAGFESALKLLYDTCEDGHARHLLSILTEVVEEAEKVFDLTKLFHIVIQFADYLCCYQSVEKGMELLRKYV